MNNGKLNVLSKGSPSKPALVFFHAFPFDARMWQTQLEFFSKDFYCIALDLPGFGGTSLSTDSMTFEHYVDLALNLLEEQNLESAVWCGLSMGGYLALRLYERAPELCRALVLCDTKAGADGNEAKLKRWGAIKTLRRSRSDFLEAQWKALVGAASYSNAALREQFNSLIASDDRAIGQGLVALVTRTDSTPLLKSIQVPTLILVGRDDVVTPVSEAQLMNEQISASELTVLDGVGHLSNLENSASFNSALNAFLSKLAD
ncbi:alpha/beta hydrolase [bacterium]|nr:alpha/beta hydrolase [bacterium]